MTSSPWKSLAAAIGALLVLAPAQAADSGTASLNRFFTQVNTVTARFQQVVLDEGLNPMQESSGTLWIERPGKFRWEYDAPFKQQIVGDGQRIWMYDIELKQVSVRRMTGALGATPAMLLAGKGRLSDNFDIREIGPQGALVWVQMKPKKSDGGFEDIRLGFDNGRLRTLEMVDTFGQTTRVTLKDAIENKPIDAARFSFKPPAGVDVIGE